MPLDRFGLFHELGVPKPWTRNSEYEQYHRVVDQAVLGDQLGYHSFWTVEHHFLPEFSHCSAPETLYPYIAAKTENIRIGHGVRLLPYPYNHPVRTAEQAAVLDLLSDGRLEYGVGRSSNWDEFEGFGIDPGQARSHFQDRLGSIDASYASARDRRTELAARQGLALQQSIDRHAAEQAR